MIAQYRPLLFASTTHHPGTTTRNAPIDQHHSAVQRDFNANERPLVATVFLYMELFFAHQTNTRLHESDTPFAK